LKELKISQEQLKRDLNVSSSVIYKWISGKSEPSTTSLIRLACYFECSVDYLIGRTDVRYCADDIFNISSIEKEQQLLKIFRTLSKDKQEQAIGVLFALKTSE